MTGVQTCALPIYSGSNEAGYETSITPFFTANSIYVVSPSSATPSTVDISIYDTAGNIYTSVFVAGQTYAYTYFDDNPGIPEIRILDSIAPDDDSQMPFGTVSALANLRESVTLYSSGTGPLTIFGINQDTDADPFTLANTPTLPLVLQPGETATFDILIGDGQTPFLGSFIDSIVIDSDANTSPTTLVALSVVGEARGELQFTDSVFPVDDQYIDFGLVDIGNMRTETVNVENIGLALSTIQQIYMVGAEVYVETFEDGLAQNWFHRSPVNWSVVDGVLRAHDIYSDRLLDSIFSGRQFTDVSIELNWESDHVQESWGYLMVRATADAYSYFDSGTGEFYGGTGNWYGFAISSGGSYGIYKGTNGTTSLLIGTNTPYDVKLGRNHLKATAIGNRLELFANKIGRAHV